MKIGAVFPQTEIGEDPAVIREYMQAVEAMGFDYVLAYDHVVGANPERPGGWRGPYTHKTPFHEVFALFSYAAALTQRLEFATGILILPQRETALVAKQAAQIDLLSGGRLRLGVGVGWNKVEMEALGFDFHTRGKRTDEQVRVLRQLWMHELVTFEGEFHSLDDVGLNPMPVQRPIPLWFGGGAEPVLRRMAKYGAGWMPNRMSVEQASKTLATIHQYLAEEGRGSDEFGVDVRLSIAVQPPETWAEEVRSWRAIGGTHFALNTMSAGYTSLDQHLGALRQFKETLR